MTLAAYLDGTVTDDTRGRVEAALAGSADLRAELVEARELVTLTTDTPPVPLSVVRAARELVGPPREGATPATVRGPWRLTARWSVAAAAAVAVCLLGYQAGVTSVGSADTASNTDANVDAVMAYGLLADDEELGADVLADLLGEVTS
jgi:anti-sigma factor RsiW